MPTPPPSLAPDTSWWREGGWTRGLLATLGVAALYVVTARIGQAVALPPGNITPVWLPSGIMFALALLWGPRIAPGVFLGAFAGNAWAYFSVESASVAARALAAGTSNGVGDVLATVGMALLYQHTRAPRPRFETLQDLLAFVGFGAVGGGLVSATFGVGGLWATGFMSAQAVPAAFLTWATGDGVGVMLLAPLLLSWRDGIPRQWGHAERFHAALVLLAAAFVPAVFFGLLDVPDSVALLLAALVPLVLWAVLSLGRRMSFLAMGEVGVVAVLATVLDRGPFGHSGPALLLPDHTAGALVSLQLFLAGLSTTMLLLSILATQRAAARAELLAANAALARLSRTDALTGLPNRLHLQEALAAALRRSARHDDDLALLIVDIDHFKRVNDTWGHNTGDEVLRQVAGALNDGVRAVDLAGRWGGEEFLVLLERCGEDEAVGVAEALRQRIAALHHPRAGGVRVSIGVGVSRPEDSPQAAVDRADQALYAAKAMGRDRVCAASQLLDTGPTLT